MTVEPVAGSRKARATETETALKEAAKRVFARKGYLSAKITDITAEAGRAAGSFYNHFVDKESLLTALLTDMAAAGDATVERSGSGHSPDFASPEAVRWHVAVAWRTYRDNAAVLLAARQAAMLDPKFAERIGRFQQADQLELADHLDRITRAGMRLPAEKALALEMMYGVIDHFAQRWLLNPHPADSPPSDDQAVDALTTFIYRGLTGRDL